MSRTAQGRLQVARALALVGLAPVALAAQARSPLAIADAGRDVAITSTLPIPVVVTLAAPASRDAARVAVFVPGSGSAKARKPAPEQQYAPAEVEPVSWVVGRMQAPRCGAPRGDVQLGQRAREIDAQLAQLRQEGARNEVEQAALATEEMNLKFEQRWDSVYTNRYNAMEMIWVKEFPLVVGEQYAARERERAREDAVEQLGEMVAVFAMADDAKRSAIYREESRVEEVSKAADEMLLSVRTELTRADAMARAGARAQSVLADALGDARGDLRDDVSLARGASRLCSGGAGIEDWISFQGTTSDPRQMVVLGRAKFDAGDAHPIVFRRVKGTDRWMGAVYWPVDATRLAVEARLGGTMRNIANDITPGRTSLGAMHRDAEKRAASLHRRLKNLKFRHEGGDGVKTIFVP